MKKRKQYEPKDKGGLQGAALTHMREIAFGKDAVVKVHNAIRRSEDTRDDQQLLDAAEEKRRRKAERNLKNRG